MPTLQYAAHRIPWTRHYANNAHNLLTRWYSPEVLPKWRACIVSHLLTWLPSQPCFTLHIGNQSHPAVKLRFSVLSLGGFSETSPRPHKNAHLLSIRSFRLFLCFSSNNSVIWSYEKVMWLRQYNWWSQGLFQELFQVRNQIFILLLQLWFPVLHNRLFWCSELNVIPIISNNTLFIKGAF